MADFNYDMANYSHSQGGFFLSQHESDDSDDGANNDTVPLSQRGAEAAETLNELAGLARASRITVTNPYQRPTSVPLAPITPNVPPPPPPPPPPINNRQELQGLAKDLVHNNNFIANLKNDEAQLRNGAEVGSKKYNKSNLALIDDFFAINLQHATDDRIKRLCVKGWSEDGLTYDYVFFHEFKGSKEEWKRVILDQMLVLYFLRRKNKKTKGELSTTATKQYAKVLFGEFRKRNVNWDMHRDFNQKGQFHSVVVAKWQTIIADDPEFATKKNATVVDEQADCKYINALLEGKMKPFENYDDLIDCSIYSLGRFALLRGKTELHQIEWRHAEWGVFDNKGPDHGTPYIKIKYPDFDKTYKLSLSNPVVRDGEKGFVYIREQFDNPFSAYKILSHLRQLCPNEQTKMFCYELGRDQIAANRNKNSKIQSNPKRNIGVNKIAKTMKNIALTCGFEDWTKFTNHAARALGITVMTGSGVNDEYIARQSRHKGGESMKPYKRNTSKMESAVLDAVEGEEFRNRFKPNNTVQDQNKENLQQQKPAAKTDFVIKINTSTGKIQEPTTTMNEPPATSIPPAASLPTPSTPPKASLTAASLSSSKQFQQQQESAAQPSKETMMKLPPKEIAVVDLSNVPDTPSPAKSKATIKIKTEPTIKIEPKIKSEPSTKEKEMETEILELKRKLKEEQESNEHNKKARIESLETTNQQLVQALIQKKEDESRFGCCKIM